MYEVYCHLLIHHLHIMLNNLHSWIAIAVYDVTILFENLDHYAHSPFTGIPNPSRNLWRHSDILAPNILIGIN